MMERVDFYIALLLTNVVVVGGWIFSIVQSRVSLRRTQRVTALADAYDVLIRVAIDGGKSARRNVKGEVIDYSREFERSIAAIHLYGTNEQVVLANTLVTKLTDERFYSADELVRLLRNDIRKEMGMASFSGRTVFLKHTVTDKDLPPK
jgi:hypothetical protein